jgi:hypothetical protein
MLKRLDISYEACFLRFGIEIIMDSILVLSE